LLGSCVLTNCSIGAMPIMIVSYLSLLHNKSRGLALGSNLNPILTQLAKTKRALFVEGKDNATGHPRNGTTTVEAVPPAGRRRCSCIRDGSGMGALSASPAAVYASRRGNIYRGPSVTGSRGPSGLGH